MKKNILFLLGLMLISALSGFSQTANFDPTNARDGETVEYCQQHTKAKKLLQNPAYVQSLQQDEITRQKEAQTNVTPKGTVYKIPVVFHVLHNNGIENISDEQIEDALAIFNRDYRLQNADAANVHADFQGMPSDVEVEFVFATKAPNGVCFTGITRTASAMSYVNSSSDGGAQVDAIIAGNDVYNGEWAGNKYMNIFVCGKIGTAAGYTYKPNSWLGSSMKNGIWILHNYVGSIGTSIEKTSRALTHEVGHWLNLDHTWGGNNNPGNLESCDSDDAVTDTPNCIGVSSCALNDITCGPRANVENYMDYSYCSKMYTSGQVTRMRNALTSSVGGRNNLSTPANLAATGADGIIYLCKADFFSDKTSICAGDSIQFSDDSYNLVTGWTWSFPSGTPSSSTEQNPVITYSTPGLYEVSLSATDGSTSDSEFKTQFIRVLPSASSLPYLEGFENYTTLTNIINWEVVNTNDNNAFVLETNASHSGNNSVKLENFNQTGPNNDELIAAPVDLSSVASEGGVVTLSFRFAYRKKASTDFEYLKVLLSADCGDSWSIRKSLGGNSLSSLVETTSWEPTSSADWTTVHLTNVTSTYWVENFRYKFRFEGESGNNLYLDDINIYLGSPSNDLVLGLSEVETIEDLVLFPNPTESELNLRFSLKNSEKTIIQIQDLFGKVLQNHVVNATIGSNLVMMDTELLASGVYFITIKTGDAQKVMQFIVK